MDGAWDVYLAAPLFNHAERAFNLRIANALEAFGLRVFLPQRDGHEFAADEGDATDRARRIYELDMATLEGCPAVVAVLDGPVPDDGVCVELGAARENARITGRAKLIVGLKTDERAWQSDGELNPMVGGCLDALVRGEDEVVDVVTSSLERLRAAHRSQAQ